ncbi:MAG TPA: 3-oxoacid CoA-transferase subunit B [Sandaracinaceae bacterium LLY-WYZ-13_1]|nr:3-oxoacid CoA-transferase subunit B [Sandaracinaceae bacterium LLY-WYZ-13_1]
MPWDKQQMAARAAREIVPGSIVNLGIGLPTLVAGHLPDDGSVWFHSENGLLGMGAFPVEGEEDPQVINAGKQTVTVVPGGSTFDSATSFAMIRGGHVDLAVLGAMQVAKNGDLANWSIPGGKTMGIGGAMDLASGAKRILVLTRHVTKQGEPKLLEACSYPLTATGCVNRIVTDLAVLDVAGDGFSLVELAPGVDEAEVREKTGAPVRTDRDG